MPVFATHSHSSPKVKLTITDKQLATPISRNLNIAKRASSLDRDDSFEGITKMKGDEGKGRNSWSKDWGEVFDQLRRKELQTLGNRLKCNVFKQVMGRCKSAGKEVVIDASTINAIFSSVVALSESEPYGIRGGSLVVLFAPAPNSEDSPVKIGKFPLDPCTVTTFELYLTIQANTAVGTRVRETLTNFVRKIGGKPTQVHIDPKFKLIKKKLYRSST